MGIKEQRQKVLKRLAKTEEKALIRSVRYDYKRGRPCYKLTKCALRYLKIEEADKLIRDYLDKQGIKYEAQVIIGRIFIEKTHAMDSVYYDFIDEENKDE